MSSDLYSETSTKEPRCPEYTSFMKSRAPGLVKKKKLKRRIVPRDREQRKRRKDRREAKLVLKEIEDLNKKLSVGSSQPDKLDSGDGPSRSTFVDAWKGTHSKFVSPFFIL
jgi:hypothetical protein